VKCWGSNAMGELGRTPLGGDNLPPQSVPAFDVDGGGATLVAVDSSSLAHYCATRADGSLLCWGRNGAAELGVDAASTPVCAVSSGERCSTTPLVVHSSGTTVLTNVISIAAVSGGTCVSVSGGDVWCWGYNGYAVTGAPVSPRLSLPPTLIPGSKLSGLSGASTHACGLGTGGVPECWGINEYAELGASPVSTPDASCSGTVGGSRCSFPMQAVSSIHATSIAANVHASFAITTDNRLFAWGSNGSGSLGHVPTLAETKNQCAGNAPCSPTPVEIVVP
jgi:alpha-tubulin suppressor-like RCC1 family protein